MILRTPLFRKVTIVGVGLMGGSLGMAIKKYNIARRVVGTSQHNSSLVYALKNKVIDEAAHDIKSAVANADLVILATPVKVILDLLPTMAKYLHRNCLITDVGSTKVNIVEAASKSLSNPSMFVGSHPLTGSEKTTAAYASAELFEGTTCLMTPTEQTNRLAKEKIKQLWTNVGAQVKFISPKEHDQILAYISHLPHILAYGLMEVIPPEFLEYATQGLRDTTRIAASSPEMWKDVCLTNNKNILKSLDELVKTLSSLRKSVSGRDEQGLLEHFQKAKVKRESISKAEALPYDNRDIH